MKRYILFLLLLFINAFQLAAQTTWIDVPFEVIEKNCFEANTKTELYISQVYDHRTGSFGVVEIYNPTNSTINLNNYNYRRSGDYGSGNWTINQQLSGVLQPKSIYLIALGVSSTSPIICNNPNYNLILNNTHGINNNDQLQILKNGNVIDDLKIDKVGTSIIRKPDVIAPKAVFDSNDWYFGSPSCITIGQPNSVNVLKIEENNSNDIRLTITGGSGTYQIAGENNIFSDFNASYILTNLSPGVHIYTIRDKKNINCYIKFKFDTTKIIDVPEICQGEILSPITINQIPGAIAYRWFVSNDTIIGDDEINNQGTSLNIFNFNQQFYIRFVGTNYLYCQITLSDNSLIYSKMYKITIKENKTSPILCIGCP